jgi:hypothetical protein
MEQSILDTVRFAIGTPPAGYEWLEYVIACVLFIMLVKAVIMLISIPFKMMKVR